MSSVEERIVSITFDNKNFEDRIEQTIISLERLTETLQFEGAKNAFGDLSESAEQFDLTPMGEAIESIESKFSVLGAVGFTIINQLTESVLEFANKTKDVVWDPLKTGGKQRALNIEQAKFLFRGLGADTEAMMDSALKAVEGTAYGLDVAAKAAAQLGGSGLQAGAEMTGALRGIAGIAAMTNTSYEEMADVFISAAGKGKVMSNELARISHRGVNAAAALAKEWGKTEAQVRTMASEGKISFEMFAEGMDAAFGEHAQKANETYSGSLANLRAALSRIGASFYGPHLEQQRDLFNALRPVVDNVHEGLKPLIATLLEIKGIGVKNLINTVSNLDFSNFQIAMPNIAEGVMNAFEGVTQILDAVKTAFRDIFPPRTTSLLVEFSEAFLRFTERIKMGDKTIALVTSVFQGFFSVLSIGWEVIKETAKLFKDLFDMATESIGIENNGILLFFARIGEDIEGAKKALVDGGGIAEFFDKIRRVIKEPTILLEKFKEAINNLFGRKGEIPGAKEASDSIEKVSDKLNFFETVIDRLKQRWGQLSGLFDGIKTAFGGIFDYIANWFSELGSKLAAEFSAGDFDGAIDLINTGLLGGIAYMFKKFMDDGGLGIDFGGGLLEKAGAALDALTGKLEAMQTDIKAGALLKIAGAVAILTASVVVLSLIDSVALTKAMTALAVGFGQLVGTMTLMNHLSTGFSGAKIALIAAAMIGMAAAAVVLSAAVKIFSTMSWEELAKGLLGVTVALGVLTSATRLIASDVGGLVRASIAMGLMSGALIVLGMAVKIFASMDWDELGRGLAGVTAGLGAMVIALNLMPEKGMVRAGIAILAISGAMVVLGVAMKIFATMSWGDIAKGLIGVAGGLAAIALITNMMPAGGLVGIGAGLVLVSGALILVASAVKIMSSMDFGSMAQGIGGIAAVLLVLAIATNAMSASAGGAAAIVIVSGALLILTNVIKELSELSLGELAMGLGAMAAVFAVLGISAILLSGAIPALLGLGAALITLGAGFALFGIGASLVAKSFEVMAKSGVAGAKAMVEALKILLTSMNDIVSAIAQSIIDMVQEFIDAAPILVRGLKVFLGHVLETIIELTPAIGQAIGEIARVGIKLFREHMPDVIKAGFEFILALMNGINDNIGEITRVAVEILANFVAALVDNMDTIIDSGIQLIAAFFGGIQERISDIIGIALSLITSFIEEIGKNAQIIIEAGVGLLTDFLSGLGSGVEAIIETVTQIIEDIIGEIAGSATKIAAAGTQALTDFLSGITGNVLTITEQVGIMITQFIDAIADLATDIMDAGLDALIQFLTGVRSNADRATHEFALTGTHLVASILGAIIFSVDQLGEIVVDFIDALADAIDKWAPEIRRAGRRLAWEIFNGATLGIPEASAGFFTSLGQKIGIVDVESRVSVTPPVEDIVSKSQRKKDQRALGSAEANAWIGGYKGTMQIKSPSRVLMRIGNMMMDGLSIGIARNKSSEAAMDKHSNSMFDILRGSLSKLSDRMSRDLSSLDEFEPRITPVLDLTRVRSEAGKISDMLDASSIKPDITLSNAQVISAATRKPVEEDHTPEPPREIKFEQNIYAPEALSTNDIYRNTRSQIALAKEELGVA